MWLDHNQRYQKRHQWKGNKMNLELIRDFKIELTGEVKINTAVVVSLKANITATASQVTQYITNNKLYSENLTEVREQILAFNTEVYNIENKLKTDDINEILDGYFNPSESAAPEVVEPEIDDIESPDTEEMDEIESPDTEETDEIETSETEEIILDEERDESVEEEVSDEIKETELPIDDSTAEDAGAEVIETPETIGDEPIMDDEEVLVEEPEGDEEEDGVSI